MRRGRRLAAGYAAARHGRRWRRPAAAAGAGRAGGAGGAAGSGAGRAPGRPGDGASQAWPARQPRPADRHRRPRRGAGRRRPAAGAGAGFGAAGVRLAGTLPGAGVPGQAGAAARRSAGGGRTGRTASARPPDPHGGAGRQPRPCAIARQAELQREIREHGWQAEARSGLGGGPGVALRRPASVRSARPWRRPGRAGGGLAAWRGRALAVVVAARAVRLVGLGDFEAAAEAARRLNADLDTLAGQAAARPARGRDQGVDPAPDE